MPFLDALMYFLLSLSILHNSFITEGKVEKSPFTADECPESYWLCMIKDINLLLYLKL
jgi:hypothetical protein